MALFNKSQQQMVLDLLISENPGLAGATLANVEFVGNPAIISGASTRAKLRGRQGAGFTGVKSFTYNRIDLGRLFASIAIQPFTIYSANQTADVLPWFNERYGLNILTTDLDNNNVWGPTATGQSIVISVGNVNSLVYYGTTTIFRWERGTRQIYDYYAQRTLTAVTTPDLMMKAFQLDFSDMLSVLQAHNTTVAFTTSSSTAQAIVDALKAKVGLPLALGASAVPGNGQYDLSGFTLSFTTPDVLENSNPRYRQIAVLSPPAVYGNQYAPIYLHFDKASVTELSGLIAHPDLNGFTVE